MKCRLLGRGIGTFGMTGMICLIIPQRKGGGGVRGLKRSREQEGEIYENKSGRERELQAVRDVGLQSGIAVERPVAPN